MSKIAFCFPGQGSLEAGMGRDIAEAVPEAMEVFERGSEASGLDLERALLRRAARGARRDRGAAAGARRDEPRDARRAARARASSRTSSSATRSASSRRSPRPASMTPSEAIALVRERGLAMAEAAREHPGSMAAILGLDDEVVEDAVPARSSASGPRTTTARARSSSRARTTPSTSAARGRRSAGARRTVKLKVSGAFHSPLVARAAERLRPAIERVQLQRADRAVHVDGDGEDRAGAADRRRCSSTSSPRR